MSPLPATLDPELLRAGLRGVLPPALAAGTVLAAARFLGGRGAAAMERAVPLAVGAGLFAGYVATHGWPGDPREADVKASLAWTGLAAALVGAGLARAGERRAGVAGWTAALLACAAAPWYVLDFMRAHHWEGSAAVLWPLGLAAGLALVLSVTCSAAQDCCPASERLAPCVGLVAALAASVALLLGRSASLAQLAGALATPLALVVAVGLPLRGPGSWLPVVVLLQAHLWAGHFAAELAGPAALGAAAVLPAPLALGALPLGRWGRWRPALVLGTALGLGALACWLAWSPPADDPYSGYR